MLTGLSKHLNKQIAVQTQQTSYKGILKSIDPELRVIELECGGKTFFLPVENIEYITTA
ncbi:DUF2642 domain-containing protein [Priestia megaterium]|uniref:Uncharacterized protein n=1 Tax=Priestia megaterium (strain ATCC 14581 / DSM 32 / CCUG 1817 / JCM 2506 / NBRC 15308 / NCIMB 9376 / NCTC 10342 / NRRL B-14308 / VKM B-512 / Ford 19) TaxID=1348623 RepID=A0A0B6AVB3_PRIM2|nr:DUF2642 domain-containing protein [Priestia megaterium]AJI24623.1 hypothetical protein BG04_1453 [Priestia megaterium NBRC 15308 = ATCC 14581]MDR4230444.1 DUF2642 domain-containing protein [Priestia megaterium]MED3805596.1 DUF2642 domain-containing protein [Priestia megaterium]MED4396310.1 DUF2642 domain-containing protein [Priestia megaterium]MED4737143.1 DUF2642 domain-containing protein [Priestia megaterium]